jgi:hypothetical protein
VSPLYLAAAVALILGAIELACRWTDRNMPEPADAQPDFTPPVEWAATAALDPRDRADLANLPECLTPRHVDHPGLACWEFDELNKQLFADTPPDEPDPVDAADDTLPDWIRRLRDDMTACEPDGFIDEIYAFLKEQAK